MPLQTTIEGKMEHLQIFVNEMSDNYINERWNPIVLYGSSNNDFDEQHHIAEFAKILKAFISKDPSVSKFSESNMFLSRIAEQSKEVWILKDGFEAFKNSYPMVCGAVDVTKTAYNGADSMVPLPFHITNGDGEVFLSSRAISWTADLLRQFRITSIVRDATTSFQMIEQAIKESETPIKSFLCSIPDQGSRLEWKIGAKHSMFDMTSAFIEECAQQGQRVLIHMHGRSYSAAICIAWLIRFRDMSYDEARSFLCSELNPIGVGYELDPALMCEKELRSWNKGTGITTATTGSTISLVGLHQNAVALTRTSIRK